jgi:aminopeptidase YwaD
MALSELERDSVLELSASQIFRHVERLCSFGPRTIGSSGDENSVEYLEGELRSCGAGFETVDFEIAASRESRAQLTVSGARGRFIECLPNYRSAPSPPGGITNCNVVDVAQGTETGYEGKDVAGAIVLATEGGMHPVPKSELAARSGAVGCVWVNGHPGGLISTYGLARYGSKIPVVSISYEDGEFLRHLLSNGAVSLSMRVDTDLEKTSGKHVIGVVRGMQLPDEVCVLCAHRETVPGSPGANDNASGVAIVLEVLKSMASRGPRRTIWGLFSTGEEGGAIGMRAFVAGNEAKLKPVKAVLNMDVLGEGTKLAVITEGKWPDRTVMTSRGLNRVLVEAASDLGFCLEPSVSNMGLADTEAFVEAGIPGAWIERMGWTEEIGWRYLHTPQDLPATIDVNALKVGADILMVALLRLDRSVSLDNI